MCRPDAGWLGSALTDEQRAAAQHLQQGQRAELGAYGWGLGAVAAGADGQAGADAPDQAPGAATEDDAVAQWMRSGQQNGRLVRPLFCRFFFLSTLRLGSGFWLSRVGLQQKGVTQRSSLSA